MCRSNGAPALNMLKLNAATRDAIDADVGE